MARSDDEDADSSSPPAPPSTSLVSSILNSPDQIAAMLSNFSTSYNVVSVGLALPILQSSALPYAKYASADTDSMCASSLLGGMVLGQLLGGALGDAVGRMAALYMAVALQIAGSLGSALLVWSFGGDAANEWLSVFDQLSLWRFVLGIGAGAVYPIAAVLSAEQVAKAGSAEGERGGRRQQQQQQHQDQEQESRKLQMIAATFSTQGVGFLAVPALTYPLLLVAGESRLDIIWRIVLGVGALPGLLLAGLRWRDRRRTRVRGEPVPLMPPEEQSLGGGGGSGGQQPGDCSDDQVEGGGGGGKGSIPIGEAHMSLGGIGEAGARENEVPLMEGSEHDDGDEGRDDDGGAPGGSPSVPQQHRGLLESIKSEPSLVRKLCGTAGTWFLFDILFYGNTLFEPIVLETAFGKKSSTDNNPDDEFSLLAETARDALFLSCMALPGYFVSIALLGRRTCCGAVHQTPRYVQMQGFALMGLLYAAVGTYWTDLTSHQALLVLLYGSTFFFANYGPNATTFLLPSVTYSHDCRSTLNGISAAAGKGGALLGAAVFEPAADAWGDARVMLICAAVSVVALGLTWWCVVITGDDSADLAGDGGRSDDDLRDSGGERIEGDGTGGEGNLGDQDETQVV